MMRKKQTREKGKIRLSRFFQNLKEGDKVAIVREPSVSAGFPSRIQGKTGTIEGMRGKAYIVKLKDYIHMKRYIVEPIHLKKIKQ
jgi:large subunit ribosomal protein L21e